MTEKLKTYVEGFHSKVDVEKMQYNLLGNTTLMLSKLGLGGGAMSGFYNEFDDSEAISTVVEAVQRGINYIDTAPYYGQGRSETVFGKALKLIPRQSYYISTKVGRYTSDWKTMFDYSETGIIEKFDQSLQRLGLDYVDLVIIHDVEFVDIKKVLSEALPAAEKIVKNGKGKYIAISGYPVDVLHEVITNSAIRIDCVLSYSRDTLIDITLQDYLPRFKDLGVGVINAAPTAMSLLTNSGPQLWHPANHHIRNICVEAVRYCKENDIELGRLAVYHVLQTKACHCVLVGMNTRKILKENLSLLFDGISEKEQDVIQYLKSNVFPEGENLHWEGVEVATYKAALENYK